MKKQLIFYIGWDAIFVLILYINTLIDSTAREAYHRFEPNTVFLLWGDVGLLMIMGAWISLLMFRGRKFELTKKSAFCEFILVGVPAFYLATYVVLPLSLARIVKLQSIHYPYFFFEFLNNNLPITAGAILLGYEIFIFITRMINIKRNKNIMDFTKPFDERDKE